ncbi:hypothetical protein OAL97_04105 [Paracoccaceae bacterium]|nr:hypothetical protein [Paracoccaceae bacterium]
MRAVLLTLLLTFASQPKAEIVDSRFELANLSSVSVTLEDDAINACWTNLKEVREYAEEKLHMQGVNVDDEKLPMATENDYTLFIKVFSQRLYENGNGPCHGTVEISLQTFVLINGVLHVAYIASDGRLTANKRNLNQAVIETVSDFIAEIR